METKPETANQEKPSQTNPPPTNDDPITRIELEYNMKTNQLIVKSHAPTVMIMGLLAMAHSSVTQNQIMQKLQAMAAQKRIVLPKEGEVPPGLKL